jgi:hypothetical protein
MINDTKPSGLKHYDALKAELDAYRAARRVALAHCNDRVTLVLEDRLIRT